MNDRERFLACMNYCPMDRTPFWEWGGWPETLERWQAEGFDPSRDRPAVEPDGRIVFDWFFPTPPFERQVLEETDETILYVNHEGILMREMKTNSASSMPQFIKFPVESREDFRKFWKERMQPDLVQRAGADWQNQLRRWREAPVPLMASADRWGGFFGPLRNLLGVENLCTLFYDDPGLLEEMMDADADFIIAIMSQILDVVSVDVFIFWEDMAYKTAPLISADLMRRYMLPRYRRVIDYLTGRGVPLIALDSDGQIDPLIPVWMDAGVNALYPFEVQAGMDVLAVRKKFGRSLRIWGGLDKRVLAKGPSAIDAELVRLRPLMEEGGFVPHTDHSIPPDVSSQNYRYYMEQIARTCGA
jgi:hypothetical protein